jgi:hypothetical protein
MSGPTQTLIAQRTHRSGIYGRLAALVDAHHLGTLDPFALALLRLSALQLRASHSLSKPENVEIHGWLRPSAPLPRPPPLALRL